MADENPYAPPESDVAVEQPLNTTLAGRGARLGASIIDGIISMAIVFPAMYFMGVWERALLTEQPSMADNILTLAVMLVGYLIVHGYTLSTRGQSLGKMMLGIRIVSITDGRILPLWKVFGVRFVPWSVISYIPLIGPILSLINILFIFGEARRCGHDYLAGTHVVLADTLKT